MSTLMFVLSDASMQLNFTAQHLSLCRHKMWHLAVQSTVMKNPERSQAVIRAWASELLFFHKKNWQIGICLTHVRYFFLKPSINFAQHKSYPDRCCGLDHNCNKCDEFVGKIFMWYSRKGLFSYFRELWVNFCYNLLNVVVVHWHGIHLHCDDVFCQRFF